MAARFVFVRLRVGLALDHPTPQNWMALLVIEKYLKAFDMAPTLDELANKLGLAAVSAARSHVLHLEELGLISFKRVGSRGHIAARSIRLTEEGVEALSKYRAMVETGILCGMRELALTQKQLERARAAEVPVDSFRRRVWKGRVVLACRNSEERDFWGERIVEALREEG